MQRVSEAQVKIGGSPVGSIGMGLLVLIGISREDTAAEADYAIQKLFRLRIFPDSEGKMNRNILEAGGAILLVSQFTLYGDCRKGNRPSFDRAAKPAEAKALYEYFVEQARRSPLRVETGVFQAAMQVSLVNEGPVTIWIDTEEGKARLTE